MMALVEEGLARYQPSLRYELLDVGEYGADDLPARNLASVLIGLESSRTPGELERWLDALLDRVRGPGERELRRAFGAWIRRVLLAHRFPGVVLERGARRVSPGSADVPPATDRRYVRRLGPQPAHVLSLVCSRPGCPGP